MGAAYDRKHGDSRFATLLDDEGRPPHHEDDDCDVCRLFGGQRFDETREEWLMRITGYTPTEILEVAS